MASIAIIGMACEFPGAHSPEQLWQNVLAGRRYFRSAPPGRMPPEYFDPDPAAPGKSYADKMAVLEGWEFDPLAFRIPPVAFEASDMAHWLALYVARAAIADSGIDLAAADRRRFGVVLGNTLTGEFSRSHNMRHRWPYAERAIRRGLDQSGMDPAGTAALLLTIRESYEGPLPEITEDTLAGNMANTIAGRICGHFDLGGGGYIVDGACSSSLLSIAHACNALLDDEMDLALAGGVDISLDPFEIVGFAKARAFARDDIRPYDEAAEGMLPGEGCGLFVLMREDDARAQGRQVHALLRGWGVSSDGAGGITAPEVEGQVRALRSAYRRAGYPISTVGLIEGHGTGTALGDKVEIAAVLRLLQEDPPTAPVHIGSIKAQIGHCKAAAGAAGLIKAVMALKRKILPPTTNCAHPSPAFGQPLTCLRPSLTGSAWESAGQQRRASVSAMGFGGANAHVTLEEADACDGPRPEDTDLLASAQSSELILLSAPGRKALLLRIESLIPVAERISRAELTDLAAALASSAPAETLRAAVVTDSPWHLATALRCLALHLRDGIDLDADSGVLIGVAKPAPRMGALFPGQGTHRINMGEHLIRRFAFVRDLYDRLGRDIAPCVFRDSLVADEATRVQWELELRDTRMAQPAIVLSSLAMHSVLAYFGLTPSVCIGHSLGEITALHAAGAFDAETALMLARARGAAISALRIADPGAMLAIAAGPDAVQPLLKASLSISNYNSGLQTVVSGSTEDIAALGAACAARGMRCTRLPVSHAFHSDIVAPAAAGFRATMQPLTFARVEGRCISTSLGSAIPRGADLKDLMAEQVRRPVRFMDAVNAAQLEAPDLWVEIGPGGVLTDFLRAIPSAESATVLPTDVQGEDGYTLLNHVLAKAFVLGFPVAVDRLFAHRFHRAFNPNAYRPVFITNPCERLVAPTASAAPLRDLRPRPMPVTSKTPDVTEGTLTDDAALLEFAAGWIARRTGFPKSAIGHDKRFRDDLNLDSIKVGELIVLLSRKAKQRVRSDPGTLANATLTQLVAALRPEDDVGAPLSSAGLPWADGAAGWVRTFEMTRMPAPIEHERARALPEAGLAILIASSDSPHVEAIADRLGQRGLTVRIADASYLLEHGDAPADMAVLVVVQETDGGVASIDRDPDGFDACVEGFAARLYALSRWAMAGRRPDAPPLRGLMLRPVDGPDDTSAEFDAGAGFIRSLRQDHPGADFRWISLPATRHPGDWADMVLRELAHGGQQAVAYEVDGRRMAEMACLAQTGLPATAPLLSSLDVALVSGGGKGVTFELALELARRTGCKLALIGSSAPPDAAGGELADNLFRLRSEGVDHIYLQADVTDLPAVRGAAEQAVARLGRLTAVLHGAGISVPRYFADKPADEFLRCIRIKARGLYNLLQVAPAAELKVLHVVSSVLGVTGMRGQTDYTFANAWLDETVRGLKARHPAVHCLSLGYSLWSETGLGHKAQLIDGLRSMGVAPISVSEGVGVYGRLLESAGNETRLVIAGSLPAELEAGLYASGKPPEGRFLEKIVRFVPGVELVAEAYLSRASDLYLDEHVFAGTPLFPGMMAIEGMAQAAMACTGRNDIPVMRDIAFLRPLAMPGEETVVLRSLAIAEQSVGATIRVRVVLRSDQDDFQHDHFAAECWFGIPRGSYGDVPAVPARLDLDPDSFCPWPLFQGKFFRRIVAVRQHSPGDRCLTDIAVPSDEVYFDDKLNTGPLVTCPAVQDALLQSGAIILPPGYLPTAAAEFRLFRRPAAGEVLHCLVAVRKTPEGYIGDLDIWDDHDEMVETVRDIALKALALGSIRRMPAAEPCSLAEAPARLRELRPGVPLTMAIAGHADIVDPPDPRRGSRLATLLATRRAAIDFAGTWQKRHLDPEVLELTQYKYGKPLLGLTHGDMGSADVTIADSAGVSIAVIGQPPIGVDLEAVEARDCETWRGLLGMEGYRLALRIQRETGETFDGAATRVWTVLEAGRKFLGPGQPIPVFNSDFDACWIGLKSGSAEFLSVLSRHPEQPAILLAMTILMPSDPDIRPLTLSGLGYDPDRIGISATTDGPRGQFVFHYRFPVGFKNAQSAGGRVYVTNYADWLGTVRELGLAPVRARLTDSFEEGVCALATNHSYLRVWADAGLDDTIEARLWIDSTSSDGGVVDLSVEWSRLRPGQTAEPIAYAAMRTSYIEIIGHGEARLASPPDFLRIFLQRIGPATEEYNAYEALERYHARTERVERGEGLASARQGAEDCPQLHEEHFQTTLEDSNVVGNVYFANYPKWIGRASDLFFHKAFPREFGPDAGGEWFTLLCDIDHLQEAMPFDRILVRLFLDGVLQNGVDLRAEFFLTNGNDPGKRLAVARVALAWVPRQRGSRLQAQPIPVAISDDLSARIRRHSESLTLF